MEVGALPGQVYSAGHEQKHTPVASSLLPYAQQCPAGIPTSIDGPPRCPGPGPGTPLYPRSIHTKISYF